MSIKIIKPGIFSTIQDMGRFQFLDQAVPLSGAMDKVSLRIANLLVGNFIDDAAIEIVDGNFECITQTDVLIALVCESAYFEINGIKIPTNRPVYVPKNSKINLLNNSEGKYSYLTVAKGWDIPEVLGSKSTFVTANFGGFKGRRLQKNDELKINSSLSINSQLIIQNLKSSSVNFPKWSIPARQFISTPKNTLHVILGNEFEWFDYLDLADFLTRPYKISVGNRMGFHLKGPKIELKKSDQEELLSTAVVPGTIQVTGNGSLILLMADCQTTGGYPRIAKVVESDLPICAQWKLGEEIYFEFIDLREAEKKYLKLENDLQKLGTAIQFKFNN